MAIAIGALIRRELLRECRRGTHYVSRTILVGVLALLVAWQLLSVGPSRLGSAQATLARYGAQLFTVWSLVQYVAAVAFSTVGGGALADERRKGTLSLTRITALGDRGVIVGWFLSVMGRVLFTMVLTLPVLVMARSFGGFTLGQVAGVVVVTVAAAAHSAALTLAIAALSASAGGAVALSLVVEALWMGRPILLRGYLSLSSVGVLLDIVVAPSSVGFRTLDTLFLVVACMLSVVPVYLLLATRFLGVSLPRPGRRLRALFLAADRLFLKLARGRGVFWQPGLGPCQGNPVLWRERAASPVGQRDHLIRLGYWVVVPVMVASPVVGLCFGYWGPLFMLTLSLVLVPLLLLAVLLLAGPATTFARERQESTLPLLAVTPLAARTIVLGKYLFALRLLLVPVVFVAAYFACYGFVLGFSVLRTDLLRGGLAALLGSPSGVPMLLVSLPVVAAALLYVGLGARSVGKALGAGLGLLVGVPLVLVFLAGQAFSAQDFSSYASLSPWRGEGSLLLLGSSVAVLALGAVLVSRARWAANVLVVGLVVAVLVGWGLWAASALLARVLGRSTGAAVVNAWTALAVVAALSVLLLWRALVRAGPGLVNRTGLALVTVGLSYIVQLMLVNVSRFFGLRHSATGYDTDLAIALAAFPIFLVVAAGLTVLFLAASTKQLDRFMERHG